MEWKVFEERRAKGIVPLVKMFSSGGPQIKKLKRPDIISKKNSFFCHFLAVAKTDQCGIGATEEEGAKTRTMSLRGGAHMMSQRLARDP